MDAAAPTGPDRPSERPRWWSWSWRPRAVASAMASAVLVFVALAAFGRLLDGELTGPRVGFAAVASGVGLVLDLRRLHRDTGG